MSPASGIAIAGQTYTIALSYRDATASTNLQPVQVLINNALDGRNACYFGFDHGANNSVLVDDLGTSLLPARVRLNGAPGGAAVMENSQCRILAAESTYSDSGQILTLILKVQMKAAFAGRRLVYSGAQTVTNGNSGWTVLGSVTVQ